MNNEYQGTPDMADQLRDEALKQNGYSRGIDDSNTDDDSRLNKNANFTWSNATGSKAGK
jgi:hypothetical protein